LSIGSGRDYEFCPALRADAALTRQEGFDVELMSTRTGEADTHCEAVGARRPAVMLACPGRCYYRRNAVPGGLPTRPASRPYRAQPLAVGGIRIIHGVLRQSNGNCGPNPPKTGTFAQFHLEWREARPESRAAPAAARCGNDRPWHLWTNGNEAAMQSLVGTQLSK
jgi:hypothetical protein